MCCSLLHLLTIWPKMLTRCRLNPWLPLHIRYLHPARAYRRDEPTAISNWFRFTNRDVDHVIEISTNLPQKFDDADMNVTIPGTTNITAVDVVFIVSWTNAWPKLAIRPSASVTPPLSSGHSCGNDPYPTLITAAFNASTALELLSGRTAVSARTAHVVISLSWKITVGLQRQHRAFWHSNFSPLF